MWRVEAPPRTPPGSASALPSSRRHRALPSSRRRPNAAARPSSSPLPAPPPPVHPPLFSPPRRRRPLSFSPRAAADLFFPVVFFSRDPCPLHPTRRRGCGRRGWSGLPALLLSPRRRRSVLPPLPPILHCWSFTHVLLKNRPLTQLADFQEAVLKIVKHYQRGDEADADGANYKLEIMRCLREVNVDNNTIGWHLIEKNLFEACPGIQLAFECVCTMQTMYLVLVEKSDCICVIQCCYCYIVGDGNRPKFHHVLVHNREFCHDSNNSSSQGCRVYGILTEVGCLDSWMEAPQCFSLWCWTLNEVGSN